jgi:23S rRNA (uracil-5-)-methyltransferase RumA
MQTELKENDEVIVDIKRLGINGEGIAFYKKLAVFVDNAIPGEGINVRITKVLPNMAFATPIEFKHTSPDRITPTCPYYNECGGCQTSHIKYERMLEFKRDLIIESISRYTKLNPKSFEIKKTLGMENHFNYRCKTSLPVGIKDGKMYPALKVQNSNKLCLIESCQNQNEKLNKVNIEICKILDEEKITAVNPVTGKGDIKYIVSRISHFNGNIQVTLVTAFEHVNLKKAAKRIISLDGVVSVFESFNDSKDEQAIFGTPSKLLEGIPTILENIGKYKFILSPEAFFQLNPVQTEVLYEEAKKAAKLSFKENVLDLYCGAGTIGIYLSKMAKKVIGIELNDVAYKNAKDNAKLNKVNNIEFYNGKVDAILPKILKDNINIDVVVCDPPRTGLGEDVCKTLLKHEFNRIVYVSCNHATLAKDLNLLSKKYDVKYIQPVDMFAQTTLIEAVCSLVKK